MTDPMNDLRQASADVSGVEMLSPAAQAVLDAASDHWLGGSNHPSKRACIATALRAAAEQVVPAEPDVDPLKACSVDHWNLMNVMKDQRNETRHRL